MVNESSSFEKESNDTRSILNYLVILIILVSILITFTIIFFVILICKTKAESKTNLAMNPENKFPIPSLNLNSKGHFDLELNQDVIKLDSIDSKR